MKSTGIVRKLDHLGRLVLPIELRRLLGIAEKDPVEVFIEGDKIILQKYVPGVDREEKLTVLANLQTLAQIEKNPNVKDTIVRAIALIK